MMSASGAVDQSDFAKDRKPLTRTVQDARAPSFKDSVSDVWFRDGHDMF